MQSLEFETGSLKITMESGDEWLHDYPLLGPIAMKNPPTFALWVTDESDNYIDTIFVTKKFGEVSWIANDDPREEALPLYSFVRGGQPTKETPAPDEITGATPLASSSYKVIPSSDLKKCKLYLEINHSLDYNSFFLEGVNDMNASNYSGGIGGSGQPALVYCAVIDRESDASKTVEFELVGYSEPGKAGNGTIYTDLSQITTAKDIVKTVKVQVL
ncbi:hypothetical protein [Sphaerochaeta pleomorpha]|nr:hypothetical protein [Sphaerochaeta pleomorpha]